MTCKFAMKATLLCLLAPVGAGAAATLREDFAYAAPIVIGAASGAYRLTLSEHVHQNIASADFRDLRVLNADGAVVPYALLPSYQGDSTPPGATRTTVPIFPLRGAAAAGVNGIRMRIQSGSGDIELQSFKGRADTNKELVGFLLDARRIQSPISAWELAWPVGSADFSIVLTVEASDDLSNWSRAGQGAIANLSYRGQQLRQQTVAIAPYKAKFWRLVWDTEIAPVEIAAATALQTAPSREEPRAIHWSRVAPLQPGSGELLFELPGRLPVDRLDVDMPDDNIVADLSFYSRTDNKQAWRTVTTLHFYKLANKADPAHSFVSGPAAIAVNRERYWRILLQPTSALPQGQAPRIAMGWRPQALLFLPRGSAPYELVYGNAAAGVGSVPVDTLLAGVRNAGSGSPVAASIGPPQLAGGRDRLVGAVRLPWKTILLWTVLIAGALALATMAYKLLKTG